MDVKLMMMMMMMSVSVACRPAEKRRRRGEIGSIHGSILVGHRRPNRPQGVIQRARKLHCINPLRTTVIRKTAGNYRYSPFMSSVLVRNRSRLGHNPDYRHGWCPE